MSSENPSWQLFAGSATGDTPAPTGSAPTGPIRIASWNVNSVRARMPRLVAFLQRGDIDVLLVQETKVRSGAFPVGPIEALGYEIAQHGLDQWNGVGIISRVGMQDVQFGFPGMPSWGEPAVQEARAITARCAGIEVSSVYVPNGREIDHPHYHYKLAWLAALREHTAARLLDEPLARMVIGGDFNIAPRDGDVWSMEFFEGRTHVTPPEREAFAALLETGLVDVVRPFTDAPGTYTYWDYTQLRFPKNRGMRLDFLLASPTVANEVVDARIDREERKGAGASDHAPVIVTVDGTSGAGSAAGVQS
ncbi:MAG: exodeoxyribonuclease III [Nakamurella sp.]